MVFRKPITVLQLIQLVRAKEDQGESYCVYGHGCSSEATLASTCYLDAYAEITEDYEEIYPGFVVQQGLELWFREELVQDVITNAESQNPSVSNEKILAAIEYYNEKDCFLVLQ